jgi:hypothetical protein
VGLVEMHFQIFFLLETGFFADGARKYLRNVMGMSERNSLGIHHVTFEILYIIT